MSGADKSKPVIRSAKGEEKNQVHRPTTRHAILGMDGPISVKVHIICYSDIYIYMSISPLSMYIYRYRILDGAPWSLRRLGSSTGAGVAGVTAGMGLARAFRSSARSRSRFRSSFRSCSSWRMYW